MYCYNSLILSLEDEGEREQVLISSAYSLLNLVSHIKWLRNLNFTKPSIFTALPPATKEKAYKILQKAKQLKIIYGCSPESVAAAAVWPFIILVAVHHFEKPLTEFPNVPPVTKDTYNKMVVGGKDLFE